MRKGTGTKRKRELVAVSSQAQNYTTSSSTSAVGMGESKREDAEYEEQVHWINFSILDMAVESGNAYEEPSATRPIESSPEVSMRRKSSRKSSISTMSSMNKLTTSACEVASALSSFLNGVDTKASILLSSKPPQKMLLEDKVSIILDKAQNLLNRWRMKLKVGMTLEFLDTQGCNIKTATVLQNLDGYHYPSSKIRILNPVTKEIESYELKKKDVAIKLDKIQHWILVRENMKTTLKTQNDDDYPLVDIGIVPTASLSRIIEAWNNKKTFSVRRLNGHRKQEERKSRNLNNANFDDTVLKNSFCFKTVANVSIPNHTVTQSNAIPNPSTSEVSQPKPKASLSRNGEKIRPSGEKVPSDQWDVPPEKKLRTLEGASNEQSRIVSQENIAKQTAPEVKDSKFELSHRSSQHKTQADSSTDFTWICALCHEAECPLFTTAGSSSKEKNNDFDRLVLCDGPCNRPFHIPCTSSTTESFHLDEEWRCKDCLSSRHACVLCGEYGEDNKDVWCCTRKGCGLFFHESCLEMGAFVPEVKVKVMSLSDNNVIEEHDSNESEEADCTTKILKFSCPAHHCWTCDDGNLFGPKSGPLFRCLYCPNAYHATCIPPTAKFHEIALLCHEHAKTHKLPDLDMDTSLQAELEKEAREKFDKLLKKKNKSSAMEGKLHRKDLEQDVDLIPFFGSLDIKGLKTRESPFLLPVDFRDQVYSKPPPYHHIQSLQYDKVLRPKRREPSGESCQCHLFANVVSCGPQCLNRLTYQECVGHADTAHGEKNRYWNCNLGINCGNRMLSRRQYSRIKVHREVGKGFGLLAMDGVKRGGLVQEYVGEVINEDTKKQRLASWAEENPNDPNFYIMQLEPGWYIDARYRGNLTRFINHSCDPNCELIPKNVAGYMRIAIVAIKDVEPGTFLSYDYKFETNQAERFACRCGSKNCRGSLMRAWNTNKGNDGENEKKSKKQLLAEAKARVERDQKFVADYKSASRKRLNLVTFLVPGADHTDGSEAVLKGPQLKYRHCNNVFLWRNVIAGSDCKKRFNRRILQRKGLWPKPVLLKSNLPRSSLDKIKESNTRFNETKINL